MTCQSISEKIHDFIDFRLAPGETFQVEKHLSTCPTCRQLHAELTSIQSILSGRLRLPEASSVRCLERIRRKRFWNEPLASLQQVSGNLRSFLRDMNRTLVMARLAALPMTLCCFAILIGQFPVLSLDVVKFPALSMQGWTTSTRVETISTKTFATRRGQTRFKELMDTAWRLPYEDSLSLVAEISPEGHARIGDVLEYPKSDELYNAADLALRSSRFAAIDSRSRPFVIFSFQKIDVWEEYNYSQILRPNIQ